MYSFNRIHKDRDNVVRVELHTPFHSSGRKVTLKDPKKISLPVSRNNTFTKSEIPCNIIRSDTFILRPSHDESSDERPDYNTYSHSKQRDHNADEKRHNFSTYSLSEKNGKFAKNGIW